MKGNNNLLIRVELNIERNFPTIVFQYKDQEKDQIERLNIHLDGGHIDGTPFSKSEIVGLVAYLNKFMEHVDE